MLFVDSPRRAKWRRWLEFPLGFMAVVIVVGAAGVGVSGGVGVGVVESSDGRIRFSW